MQVSEWVWGRENKRKYANIKIKIQDASITDSFEKMSNNAQKLFIRNIFIVRILSI